MKNVIILGGGERAGSVHSPKKVHFGFCSRVKNRSPMMARIHINPTMNNAWASSSQVKKSLKNAITALHLLGEEFRFYNRSLSGGSESTSLDSYLWFSGYGPFSGVAGPSLRLWTGGSIGRSSDDGILLTGSLLGWLFPSKPLHNVLKIHRTY